MPVRQNILNNIAPDLVIETHPPVLHVRATRPFYNGKRLIAVGTEVPLVHEDARALIAAGKATLV